MIASGEKGNGHPAPRAENLQARLAELAQRLRTFYDTRPVTRDEWDAASGDES